MAKLFGQFLVEKSLISEEELLQVLMEQVSRAPQLHEILYRNRFLQPSDLIRAFAYQYENDCDFKVALKHLKLWTERIKNDVNRVVRNHQVPIGQILVRNGRVTFEVMNQALEEFLAATYKESSRVKQSVGHSVPSAVDLSPAEDLDQGLVKQCAELVSKILDSDLSDRLQKLAETEIYDEALCDSIVIDLHRMRSAMNFVGANINAGFLEVIETSFHALTSDDGFGDWTELTDLVVEGLAIVADYTKDILVTQSETSGYDKFREIEDISNNLRQLVTSILEIGQHHRELKHAEHSMRVLLVEPAKSLHRYFTHCLAAYQELGPVSSLDAKDATLKLKSEDIGIVLVEHGMAQEAKFIEFVRATYSKIPIVLLTSVAENPDTGNLPTLMKPFSEQELVATLKKALAGKSSKKSAA